MKTLELSLQKRLLIVEGDMLEFKLNDKRWLNDQLFKICKGYELTEEIARNLVNPLWDYYKNYLESDSSDVGNYKRLIKNTALESFISAIEAQGYYWGENPIQSTVPTSDLNFYDNIEVYHHCLNVWQEAESKTFNPEKSLIFEIL